MAKMATLTKRSVGDFKLVITGASKNYTKTFARADYDDNQYGVKLLPYLASSLMIENFLPAEWTIDAVTGFTTNEEVTEALTALAIQ